MLPLSLTPPMQPHPHPHEKKVMMENEKIGKTLHLKQWQKVMMENANRWKTLHPKEKQWRKVMMEYEQIWNPPHPSLLKKVKENEKIWVVASSDDCSYL